MLKNIMRVTDTELHAHYTVRELIHTHTHTHTHNAVRELHSKHTLIVLLPVVTVELHVVCLANMMNNCFNTWCGSFRFQHKN